MLSRVSNINEIDKSRRDNKLIIIIAQLLIINNKY